MRIAAVNRSSSISYGIGGTPYAIKEAAYTMFVLLFYTQVLGLGGTEAGIVLFLGLLWDAVSDPLMGGWSDRFKSRWRFTLKVSMTEEQLKEIQENIKTRVQASP